MWHTLTPGFTRWPLLAVGLAVWLGGCVMSSEPLFDTKLASTPAALGRYSIASFDGRNWKPDGESELSIVEGGAYRWDGQAFGTFYLFDIGNRLFVVSQPQVEDGFIQGYAYSLVENNGGVFFQYPVECRTIIQNPTPAYTPVMDGRTCKYFSREAIAQELRSVAKRLLPIRRYMPVARK